MSKKQSFKKKEFVKAVIAKRVNEDITVRNAAKQIGVSKSSVFRAETTGILHIEAFPKFCNWLGVPVSKFF